MWWRRSQLFFRYHFRWLFFLLKRSQLHFQSVVRLFFGLCMHPFWFNEGLFKNRFFLSWDKNMKYVLKRKAFSTQCTTYDRCIATKFRRLVSCGESVGKKKKNFQYLIFDVSNKSTFEAAQLLRNQPGRMCRTVY